MRNSGTRPATKTTTSGGRSARRRCRNRCLKSDQSGTPTSTTTKTTTSKGRSALRRNLHRNRLFWSGLLTRPPGHLSSVKGCAWSGDQIVGTGFPTCAGRRKPTSTTVTTTTSEGLPARRRCRNRCLKSDQSGTPTSTTTKTTTSKGRSALRRNRRRNRPFWSGLLTRPPGHLSSVKSCAWSGDQIVGTGFPTCAGRRKPTSTTVTTTTSKGRSALRRCRNRRPAELAGTAL